MSCLEQKDLSKLAKNHIDAQKSNIKNQRTRLTEIEAELTKLKSQKDASPLRIKEAENAIADLQYHLNGKVKREKLITEIEELKSRNNNPKRLADLEKAIRSNDEFIQDPNLDIAERRMEMMEQLYTQRAQYQFVDTAFAKDKDGNPIPRYASVFGAPTVKKMLKDGEQEVAEDLILRSISMVMSGDANKNPFDYIDTEGLEVKKALGDGIEHHHVFNNVYLDENGKVTPNSVRFFRNSITGDIEMQVVPEYWNSEKHGRNTQFIELMDGAHSGDDTATHLHYYKFDGKDSEFIKGKIKEKVKETVITAANRLPKLQSELDALKSRRANPQAYENNLIKDIEEKNKNIAQLDKDEEQFTNINKAGNRVKRRNLTDDEEAKLTDIRNRRKELNKELGKVEKSLDEHRSFISAEGDIKKWGEDVKKLEQDFKSIKLNVKFPNDRFSSKDEARGFRDSLKQSIKSNQLKIKSTKQMLKEKGSIDQQIRDKEAKLNESQQLSQLTEEFGLQLYEQTNGFFSFDKGHQESQDYSKSRPKMNKEIHKLNAREATEYLEQKYGEKAIEALQNLARKSYQRNLYYNLRPIADKVRGTL
jgi:hypothetical protein